MAEARIEHDWNLQSELLALIATGLSLGQQRFSAADFHPMRQGARRAARGDRYEMSPRDLQLVFTGKTSDQVRAERAAKAKRDKPR